MKKLIVGLVVGFVVGWAGVVEARAPIHNSYAFGTSGTTALTTHKAQFDSSTFAVALVPTGDDVWITIDGSTTPVDGQHWFLEADNEYIFKTGHALYIKYTVDGDSAGYLNVIEYSTWWAPY